MKTKAMKTKIILMLVVITNIAFAQIPNNGFENWTSQGAYNTPDSWDNLNGLTTAASVYTCTKGTPGNVGAAYIKLISKTVAGLGVVPGVVVSGAINTTSFTAASGFAYTGQPVSLKGKWQHMANGSDEGFISVYLTKWNTTTSTRDTVASAVRNLGAMVMSWAAFTINLNYLSTTPPDSAVIVLSASGANGVSPVNGSYLYVDELTFFGTVGINENNILTNDIQISPNPSSSFFNVNYRLNKESEVSLIVTDITGKKVKELTKIQATAGENSISVQTAGLSKGVYFMTLTVGKDSKTEKLIIQ